MKKTNKNRRIAIYIVIAAVFIGLLYYASTQSETGVTGSTIINAKEYDYSRAGNPEYYSLLPAKPADFDSIRLMWERGIIRDVPEKIDETYWKQPEWFPNYAKTFVPALEKLVEAGNREPIWSLGIFDSQIYRRINQGWLQNPYEPNTTGHGIIEIKNDSVIIKHRFWLRASPGATRRYGVGLSSVYPEKTYLKGNALWGIPEGTISQDAEIAKEYINLWAAEGESGGTEFSFGVYWPKLEPNYIREIWVTTEIKKDIPKGIYIVGIDAGAPSREYQHEQSLKYGLGYTDPNIGMYRGPSEFRIFIEII